jgi:hypothetical protein
MRCYTRALKNAHHLQGVAPEVFAQDPSAEGLGTGVPLEILRGLHRLAPNSPVLNRHKQVAAVLRRSPPPLPQRNARDALFSGMIYFAQVTFQTPGGDLVIPTADMNQIVEYMQKAIVPISEYASQYGANSVSVSANVLGYSAKLSGTSYSNSDLKGYVNAIASAASLPTNSCVFVVSPQGVSSSGVAGNEGYHDKANIPFVVAGVYATGLTLADAPDVYAMVVSHEIAEMVVDPNVDGNNPEVCDACDINCGNLTRCYFDQADNFLGVNQKSPPGGFAYTYYTCAVVKPEGAGNCPASAADCQYQPVTQDCRLIIDKSTFGEDEVEVTTSYPAAYWVALDGFTAPELGFNLPSDLNNPTPSPAPRVAVSLDPALNSGLSATQLATIGANLPSVDQLGPLPVVAIDPTLAMLTQRFLYPYTISFSSVNAFEALQVDQAVVLTLTATFTVGQITVTDTAAVELVRAEDPYFTDVDPAQPTQPSWLSFDLRFFKIAVPNGGKRQRFGADMTSNPDDAPGFIANVIKNLTANAGDIAGDTFTGLATDEDSSALEFLQQDSSGNYVFNFAVARVRLLGKTAGAQAASVRAFFRLFQAQTTNSSYDQTTTYRQASDGAVNGHKIPLLGIQGGEYVTIPCFATRRINLSAQAMMGDQTDPPNVQTITVNPGVEVDTYFGCWLDVNQPQQAFLPATSPPGKPDGPWTGITPTSINQAITRAPHQCLIAEIAYDPTPIPTGATSSTSDKLAQRNVAWIDGPNPGAVESRLMPHPFDIKASTAAAVPDELMILWGDTPAGSSASLYVPALKAADILTLADAMYGTHKLQLLDVNTVRSPAAGVTFVPIPAGTAATAGLLTVELPPGIKRGDIHTATVRQVTSSSVAAPPPPPPIQRRGQAKSAAVAPIAPAARTDLVWRQVEGFFAVTMVISRKEKLLLKEERTLAWLRWIFHTLPPASRWYPVWARYLDQIAERVSGFGGDPGKILPSPTGTVPGKFPGPPPTHHKDHDRRRWTGKVVGLIHDRFGDFEGFLLLTEYGEEREFSSHEHAIERLAQMAWAERRVITVFADRDDPEVPSEIVVRRAPEPFQH